MDRNNISRINIIMLYMKMPSGEGSLGGIFHWPTSTFMYLEEIFCTEV